MSPIPIHNPPIRITDLIELKGRGAAITCAPTFEIIPVEFTHRSHRFQALVFLCRFSGTVAKRPYTFRKCYARGCTHDLCPRVSQAVLIANRHLQRDYQRLEQVGIPLEKKLFSLEASLIKLMDLKEELGETSVIDDFIQLARDGGRVSVEVALEYVPATEHFEHHKNRQTFLMADFKVTTRDRTVTCQRCLGCYATAKEREDGPVQIQVANDRLSLLYREFELADVSFDAAFFTPQPAWQRFPDGARIWAR
jgi:hypothetical protein